MLRTAALGLALLVCASAPAGAHSWYPYDCCSDRDCWPMGVDSDAREPDPAIVPGGYRLRDGTFVAEAETRPSRDGRFHICRESGRANGGVIAPIDKPVCLFVPKPTF
jgi:hypothetical protein